MRKEGFTLIELLAVIVILAVIALIATPIILNVINDAKEQANLRAVEGYAKAVEYANVQYMFKNSGAEPTDFASVSTYVNYQGATVSCTSVGLTGGKVTLTGCTVGGSAAVYSYNGSSGATKSS